MKQDEKAVVVVEDEDCYRDLLVRLLSQQPGIRVVGDFASATAALTGIPKLRPHVAVLDISLGRGINGIQLGLKLRATLPNLGIVLLSSYLEPSVLRVVPEEALAGWSYLHKNTVGHIETLVHAIVQTADGTPVRQGEISL